jgi:hypothetical protein
MTSQAIAPRTGYLLCEDSHNQVMRGLDTLRFLEGLATSASNSPHRAEVDMEDLAGFLQLLLSQTRDPLKRLEYSRWLEADRPAKEHAAPLDEAERQLIEHFRKMETGDRAHLSRFAQVLAGSAAG